MLLYLTLLCVVTLCMVSFFVAAVKKKGRLMFLFFGYLFLALVVELSISFGEQSASALSAEATHVEQKEEIRTSLLTWYIPEGANTSEENVYIAVTESGSYRFCYFEDDGISIRRAQLKADSIDIQSTEEAPARVDWYYQGDVLTKVVVYIPDDANAIMFEPEDHSLPEDDVNSDGT